MTNSIVGQIGKVWVWLGQNWKFFINSIFTAQSHFFPTKTGRKKMRLTFCYVAPKLLSRFLIGIHFWNLHKISVKMSICRFLYYKNWEIYKQKCIFLSWCNFTNISQFFFKCYLTLNFSVKLPQKQKLGVQYSQFRVKQWFKYLK